MTATRHAPIAAEPGPVPQSRLRVCLCGASIFHLSLLARAVGRICPALNPAQGGDFEQPGTRLAAAFPEMPLHRVLLAGSYGTALRPPARAGAEENVTLDHSLCEHPLILYNDVLHSYTPALFKSFDRIIYLQRDVRDMFAADAELRMLLLGKADDPTALEQFCRCKHQSVINLWNAQIRGFHALAEQRPVHFVDFDALVLDCPGQMRELGAFLGRPHADAADYADLTMRSALPPSFAEKGAAARILPPDILRALERDCGEMLARIGAQPCSSAPEVGATRKILRWDEANHLHYLSPRAERHVVVHIPARSGSTRLPDKNIADLGGLPLMAWTIRLALQLPDVHRVIVNTDDADYAAIAREHGAETPFLRPKAISGVDARLDDADRFLAEYLQGEEGYHIAKLVTLYPTTPFRAPDTVAELIEALDTHQLVHSCLPSTLEWSSLYADSAAGCRAIGAPSGHFPRTSRLFKPTGYFIGRSFVSRKQGVLLVPPRDPLDIIDIDEPNDLDFARYLLSTGVVPGSRAC